MNADVVSTASAKATIAHRRLADAVAALDDSYWAIADAVWVAYADEAWNHDDGERREAYESRMHREGLPSIFVAYCLEEFGLGNAPAHKYKLAGKLREMTSPNGRVTWDRFSLGSVQAIAAAGVQNTYEPADLAETLAYAETLASKDAARFARNSADDIERSPVTNRHVRKAMAERNIVAPKLVDGERAIDAADARAHRIERASARVERDVRYLIAEHRVRAVVNLAVSIIRRLADRSGYLDELAAAIDEARHAS